MNKTFTKLKCTALAAAAITAFCSIPAFAQFNHSAASATNLVTTYTDLGTTGTAITVANNDDATSAATPIGFTFNYNSQAFTNFVLNTNGYIKLGSTASAATLISPIPSGSDADINIISPLSGVDLKGATNQTTYPTEFRVVTTGTAPNRVTTIQWENLEDKATPSASANAQFTSINFQVKLYETTNVIEFVYGPWVSNGATPTSGQPFIVGLKGITNGALDRLLAAKPSSGTPWSGTSVSFTTGPTGIPSHFVRNTFLPDAGRTYRFTPVAVPANDAGVESIYNLSKVATTGGANSDVIQARVRNFGSAPVSNVVVTLAVTGANATTQTVTIPTLGVAQIVTVTFPAATMTTAGTNNITVSVPSDNVNTNNSATTTTAVTANTLAYYRTNVADNSVGFGPTGNAAFLVRLNATGSSQVRVSTVRAYISDDADAVGKTVYGVVVDSLGNLIGRSPDYVITTGDLEGFKAFNITTTPTSGIAPVVSNTAYYVGLAQPTYTGVQYFPMGFQNELPQRRKAYYTWGLASTTPTKPAESLSGRRYMIEADVTNITGVKEEINNTAVSVYPNPGNGVFHISAKDMKGANLNLEVRDLQGKLVYSAKAGKEGASINLKNMAAGVYMLQVSTDSEISIKR